MIRQDFNSGWTVAPLGSMFERTSPAPATAVDLPHDALLTTERSAQGNAHLGYFKEGSWQYKKLFTAPAEWAERRVTLEFEGAYRGAMVFVNGAFAGQWATGYSTFEIRIDPFLHHDALNEVIVELQVHEDSRWYSGGGLYRPVNLLVGELIRVESNGLRVSTPEVDEGVATVLMSVAIANDAPSTRTLEALVEVVGPEGEVVSSEAVPATVVSGERATLQHRAYVRNPARWSVESPSLYTARVQLRDAEQLVDVAETSFGIRTVTLDPVNGLRINGETVKLRGASLHADHGIIGAAEFSRAADRRIRRLKAAGFNAVRSAAKPASRAILDACDRHGMLVMDETWDMWHQVKTHDDFSRRFADWWERDLEAMVVKDYNHPSVILYSLGSEIIEAGTPHGARMSRLISNRLRSLDPTRFITNSINGLMVTWTDVPVGGVQEPEAAPEAAEESSEETVSTEEAAVADESFNFQLSTYMETMIGLPSVGERLAEGAATVDIFGLNYGHIRYELDHENYPDRIFLGTETFPATIAYSWKKVTELSFVIGDFTWVGWDYLGEPGVGRPVYPGEDPGFTAPYPWLTSDCGDIDLIGQRKPVSFYRETVFGLRTDPYLAIQRPEHREHPMSPTAWSWSDTVSSWTWNLDADAPVTVEAYADADEVAFLVNGEEVARAEVGTDLPFVATAEVPYRPGTIEAVSYRAGVEQGRFSVATAGAPARLDVSSEGDGIRADSQDIAFVDIALVDDQGLVHTPTDVKVTVDVAGPGVLAGLGSARGATEESFSDASYTTYEGRALAIVRYAPPADGSDGDASIEVTVSAEGFAPVTLTLPVHSVD